MWDNFSYLFLMFLFAGIPALIMFILGYHIVKLYARAITKTIVVFVIITPIIDKFALEWGAWAYNPDKNLGLTILNSPLETLFFSVLITVDVAMPVVIWTFYEDNKKPIFKTSLHDIFHGTYAIWVKK